MFYAHHQTLPVGTNAVEEGNGVGKRDGEVLASEGDCCSLKNRVALPGP